MRRMLLTRWKALAGKLKRETYALSLAYRSPGVPWYAKLFALCVVAYAFSPIDLIPDFIPVLGYIDDLILLPPGVALAIRMIPRDVMSDCRRQSEEHFNGEDGKKKPRMWGAAVVIIGLWLSAAVLIVLLVVRTF